MPEMSAGRRGAGGGVWMRDAPTRHYGPDQAGGLCEECGHPMVAQLAGDLRHPTCDPTFVPMVKRLQIVLARRRREGDDG